MRICFFLAAQLTLFHPPTICTHQFLYLYLFLSRSSFLFLFFITFFDSPIFCLVCSYFCSFCSFHFSFSPAAARECGESAEDRVYVRCIICAKLYERAGPPFARCVCDPPGAPLLSRTRRKGVYGKRARRSTARKGWTGAHGRNTTPPRVPPSRRGAEGEMCMYDILF